MSEATSGALIAAPGDEPAGRKRVLRQCFTAEYAAPCRPTRAPGATNRQEDVMAKGQMRGNKEKKKPKAEWNKKKKGGPAPSPFALTQSQPAQNPFAKKT